MSKIKVWSQHGWRLTLVKDREFYPRRYFERPTYRRFEARHTRCSFEYLLHSANAPLFWRAASSGGEEA